MTKKSMYRQEVFNCHQYQAGKTIEEVKRELGIDHIVKLSSNENPFGPSPRVFEAITPELQKVSMYPERSFIELKEAIIILVDTKQDCMDVFQHLMRKGVLVRPASNWGYTTHIRVTIGSHEDNETFIRTLKEVL